MKVVVLLLLIPSTSISVAHYDYDFHQPLSSALIPKAGCESAGFFVSYTPEVQGLELNTTGFGDLITIEGETKDSPSLIWLHGHGSSGSSVNQLLSM